MSTPQPGSVSQSRRLRPAGSLLHSALRAGLLLAGFAWVGTMAVRGEVAAPRPNLVFIYADDLGYGDLSCYGQQKFTTPHLDALAEKGMRFTQFYSGSPVCAPARAILLTGLHAGHSPIRGNREVRPEGQHPLPAASHTFVEMLRSAGYATGAFGKWGLGFIGTEGDPRRHGFEHFFGYNCQRWAHRAYPPYLWSDDRWYFLPGNDMTRRTTYAPDVIQQKALAFIRENRTRPFFLFLPTTLPHAELAAPDDGILARFRGRFPERPFPGSVQSGARTQDFEGPDAAPEGYPPQAEPLATYAAMITRLDRHVGEIVELLDELGLTENTLVLFSSDNGPHREGGADPEFFNSSGSLRGGKRDLYEGGIRVPLIARWPGRVPAGVTSDHPCAAWDVFATVAELTQGKPPQETDGISFLPALLAQGEQTRHEVLYWEMRGGAGHQAVRWGDWKGVLTRAVAGRPEAFELFDLASDPGESRSVAAENPERVAHLRALIRREHRPDPVFKLPGD